MASLAANSIANFAARRIASLFILMLGFRGGLLLAATPATQSDRYATLTAEYMSGNWDELQADLKATSPDSVALSPAQKADIDYIKQTLTECRPWWWIRCKQGKRTQLRATIFNLPVTALYDPQQKQGMNVRFTQDSTDVTLGWDSGDMDNPAPAEHGFSKGDLSVSAIWCTLGMTAGYLQVPYQSLINMNEADKVKLTAKLDFRGNLAAAYYSNPRSRRWWTFLSLQYFEPRYQASPIVMSREALGAMFVDELVAHRAKYPSIQLPDTVQADDAETKLALAVHGRIERHEWTFAEDKSIRQAVKQFALANQLLIRTGGPVVLPSGLQMSLDPQEDTTLRLKRDLWLVEKLSEK